MWWRCVVVVTHQFLPIPTPPLSVEYTSRVLSQNAAPFFGTAIQKTHEDATGIGDLKSSCFSAYETAR